MSVGQMAFVPAPSSLGVATHHGAPAASATQLSRQQAVVWNSAHIANGSAAAASAAEARQSHQVVSVAAGVGAAALVTVRRGRRLRRHAAGADVVVPPQPKIEVPEEIKDIETAGQDIDTPHWSQQPMKEVKGLTLEQLTWKDLHGASCVASGVLFLAELVRFVAGLPPSDAECYFAAVVYAIIYASRFDGIRPLPPHFRVTFYATTGWTVYYISHLLAATNPAIFAHSVYPTGIIFLASTIYFYKHWIERMYRHFVEDRFRPYYLPGLMGLMYFHGLDCVDLFNQWIDPQYWQHVPLRLTDQAWTIQDVRLTGLFMSSMALFMITLHNKGVLTGGRNTLITVLFTIFVPALFLTGTHATLNASFP